MEPTKEQIDAYADGLEPFANELQEFARSRKPNGLDFMYVIFASAAFYLEKFEKDTHINAAIHVLRECQRHTATIRLKEFSE